MLGTACTALFSQILVCIVLRREKFTLQTKDGAVLRVYEINVMTKVVTPVIYMCNIGGFEYAII